MWERLGKLYWDIQLQPPRDSLVLSSVFGFCLFVVLGIKHKALRAVKHARQVLYHWTTSLTLVLVFSRFDSFCLPATTFPRLSLLSVGLFPVFFPCACVLHSSSAPVFPWQRSCACSHLLPSLLWTPVVSTANVILLCLVLPVRFLFSNICYKNVWVLREVHYLKKIVIGMLWIKCLGFFFLGQNQPYFLAFAKPHIAAPITNMLSIN